MPKEAGLKIKEKKMKRHQGPHCGRNKFHTIIPGKRRSESRGVKMHYLKCPVLKRKIWPYTWGGGSSKY